MNAICQALLNWPPDKGRRALIKAYARDAGISFGALANTDCDSCNLARMGHYETHRSWIDELEVGSSHRTFHQGPALVRLPVPRPKN